MWLAIMMGGLLGCGLGFAWWLWQVRTAVAAKVEKLGVSQQPAGRVQEVRPQDEPPAPKPEQIPPKVLPAEKPPDPALVLLAEAESQLASCKGFMHASALRNQKLGAELQEYRDTHPNSGPQEYAAYSAWRVRNYSAGEIKLFQTAYGPKMLAVRNELLMHVPDAADVNNDYTHLENLADVVGICSGFESIVNAYKRQLAKEASR